MVAQTQKLITMKQYHIFHATSPLRFTETEIQPRVYAGFVNANSIEEAFQKSQNGGVYNTPNSWSSEALPWNPTNPCRSTLSPEGSTWRKSKTVIFPVRLFNSFFVAGSFFLYRFSCGPGKNTTANFAPQLEADSCIA